MASRNCSALNLRLKPSVRDRLFDPKIESPTESPETMGLEFLESAIVRGFFIDINNIIKIKAALTKQFHISPTAVDMMPFWEYEMWMEELNALVKEENESQEKEQRNHNLNKYSRDISNFQKNMPKTPNWGSGNINIRMPGQ